MLFFVLCAVVPQGAPFPLFGAFGVKRGPIGDASPKEFSLSRRSVPSTSEFLPQVAEELPSRLSALQGARRASGRNGFGEDLCVFRECLGIAVQEKAGAATRYILTFAGIHCEDCAEELKTALNVPGIKQLEISIESRQATFVPDKGAVFRPADIQRLLPKKFSLENFEVVGLKVLVREMNGVLLICGGYPEARLVAGDKEGAALQAIRNALLQGVGEFHIAGSIVERKEKQKNGKERKVLQVLLQQAAPVRSKK